MIDAQPVFDEWLSKQTFCEENPNIKMGRKDGCTCGRCYASSIVEWMWQAFHAGYNIRGELDKVNALIAVNNMSKVLGFKAP